jgi:hypothetical protein
MKETGLHILKESGECVNSDSSDDGGNSDNCSC